jgi:hypothetical protein
MMRDIRQDMSIILRKIDAMDYQADKRSTEGSLQYGDTAVELNNQTFSAVRKGFP